MTPPGPFLLAADSGGHGIMSISGKKDHDNFNIGLAWHREESMFGRTSVPGENIWAHYLLEDPGRSADTDTAPLFPWQPLAFLHRNSHRSSGGS